MAKQKTQRKIGSSTEHIAYWKMPWVKKVLCGECSAFAKLLFMRVASFGVSGCWMENVTLAAELGTTERYITMLLTELWKSKELWITNWNSSKRKIYANNNPEVVVMVEERYKTELKNGNVKDRNDFYRKTKSRRYSTPNNSSG